MKKTTTHSKEASLPHISYPAIHIILKFLMLVFFCSRLGRVVSLIF